MNFFWVSIRTIQVIGHIDILRRFNNKEETFKKQLSSRQNILRGKENKHLPQQQPFKEAKQLLGPMRDITYAASDLHKRSQSHKLNGGMQKVAQ